MSESAKANTAGQFAAYCQQRMDEEQDDDRRNAYRAVCDYLAGTSAHPLDVLVWLNQQAAEKRRKAQEIRAGGHGLAVADSYTSMAGIYEELCHRLPAYPTLGKASWKRTNSRRAALRQW
jgi:hypothetical protein